MLGLGGIFKSLPDIFTSIMNVESIFKKGEDTLIGVKNVITSVKYSASGQELLDAYDNSVIGEIHAHNKRKLTAKAMAAAAIVGGVDPKVALEASKELEHRMKEKQKVKKDTRKWRQDDTPRFRPRGRPWKKRSED